MTLINKTCAGVEENASHSFTCRAASSPIGIRLFPGGITQGAKQGQSRYTFHDKRKTLSHPSAANLPLSRGEAC